MNDKCEICESKEDLNFDEDGCLLCEDCLLKKHSSSWKPID